MFLQQPKEVKDGGFVGNALQVQPGKLSPDCGFIQRHFTCRIGATEPVLQQVHILPRHQRIRRKTSSTLRVMRFDQTFPRHHPPPLDQKQLFAALLALASVLGVGEVRLLHRKTQQVESGYFAKIRKFFKAP